MCIFGYLEIKIIKFSTNNDEFEFIVMNELNENMKFVVVYYFIKILKV